MKEIDIKNFINKNKNISKNPISTVDSKPLYYENIPKLGPIYSMHRYWTKQNPEVIIDHIKRYCCDNGIVLDCFCGVGSTGVASLITGRRGILLDISPAANFISSNYIDSSNLEGFTTAMNWLREKITDVNFIHFSSDCPSCKRKIIVEDYIYSDVYQCPHCKTDNIFVDKSIEEIKRKKRSKNIFCSTCSKHFKRSNNLFVKSIPIGKRINCKDCEYKKEFFQLNSKDEKFLETQSKILNKLDFKKIALPEDGISSKQPLKKGIRYVHELYSANTFNYALKLMKNIKTYPDVQQRKRLLFVFTSCLYRVSLMYRLRVDGKGGLLSGTLYVPPVAQDINFWNVYEERFRKIYKGLSILNKRKITTKNDILVLNGSATDMKEIPDESIDYCYTDPPYGSNINYNELNLLWESWLEKFTDKAKELIISNKKSPSEYKNELESSFKEIWRVLKFESIFTLVFHHTDPKIWSLVQEAVFNTKFSLFSYSEIASRMTTAKQTQYRKTAKGFILLHFKKESSNNKNKYDDLSKLLDTDITNFLRETLKIPQTRSSIYNKIIYEFFAKKKLTSFDLDKILSNNFHKANDILWKK